MSTKKAAEVDIPICITGDMALWKDSLYCLGEKDNVRGIYEFNTKKKEIALVLEENKKEAINGFSLNY